jgi:hypothetical protein
MVLDVGQGPSEQARGTSRAPEQLPVQTDIQATVTSSFPRLTTKLTTKPRDFGGLMQTWADETPYLTCENGLTQTALDQLDGIGNRVTCKGPWVKIPPPPLLRILAHQRRSDGTFQLSARYRSVPWCPCLPDAQWTGSARPQSANGPTPCQLQL